MASLHPLDRSRQQASRPGPVLLPPRPAASPRLSPLEHWHLLSLDAPSVAAVWTWFIAWAAQVQIPRTQPIAMFLAVWILYAADRLLDAKPLFTSPHAPELRDRHRFHHAHRSPLLVAIVIVAAPLLVLLHHMPAGTLHLYVELAGLLCLWLLLVHTRREPTGAAAHRLPKELAVGLFFPAAIFIPTVARAPALRLPLLPEALCLALLCTLNCLLLYSWEHPASAIDAHPSTRWGLAHLQPMLLLGIALPTLCAVLMHQAGNTSPHRAATVYLACALSGLFLLLLNRLRHRLPALRLRALADFVLLSPLLVWCCVFLAHPRV